MRTYSDEHIERWGNIYVANNIGKSLIIPFSLFLNTPRQYVEVFLSQSPRMSDNGPYPLLPKQIMVHSTLSHQEFIEVLIEEGEIDHQGNTPELHGDHLITPMHHRDFPKKWKTNSRRISS